MADTARSSPLLVAKNLVNALNTELSFAAVAADFRRDHAAVETVCEELFADLDQLRRELDRRESALSSAEHELAVANERSAQAATRLAEVEARCAKLEADGDELRRQLAAAAPSTTQLAAALQELGRLVAEVGSGGGAEVSQQFSELKEQLAQRPQFTTTGGDDVPWGIVQTELAELRRQLFDTREALTAEIIGSDSTSEDAARVVELEQQLTAARLDFAAVEAELTAARGRLLESHDAASMQKQELAAEREQNARELKLLRQMVEELRATPQQAAAAPPAKADAAADGPNKTGDPVISSVMAQFAKLQKDVAQRRKK